MSNRSSDTTVRYNREQNQVHFTNQQSQTFSEEDFVQVYNDNLQNYKALKDKVSQLKEQRQEILEEDSEELAVLNYVLGSENHEEPGTEIEHGVLDENVFEKHQKLQQIKDQLEQLGKQRERLEEQLDNMKQPAEAIAEGDDEVELEEYNKEE